MFFRYKVTLAGIKGFYRIYDVDGNTTLYTFHKQMRADMEFPQDQLIMFKALDSAGEVLGRYGLFDLGFGTVDAITLRQTVENGVQSFVYFYDVTNRKSVIVSLLDEVEGTIPSAFPRLEEVKGPNPADFENGYVAFEDLPDEKRVLPSESPEDEDFDDEDLDEEEEEEDLRRKRIDGKDPGNHTGPDRSRENRLQH